MWAISEPNLASCAVAGGIHEFFQIAHHLIEVFDGVAPGFGIEFVEGFFVVAAEFGFRLAFEFRELAGIPRKPGDR